jgi:hypothetical protein
MKFKIVFIVSLAIASAATAYGQNIHAAASGEAASLKTLFVLSAQQEDSLTALLPAYYNAKAVFLQHPYSDTGDAKELQALYDGILKKIFTDEQYRLYEKIKMRQLQLMYERTKPRGDTD